MRCPAVIAILLPFVLTAQVPVALLDTTTIRIGEQAIITLAIDLSHDQLRTNIAWPQIPDTIGRIEVVKVSSIDTLSIATGTPADRVQLSQTLAITSFDTGFWAIPPFIFKLEGQDHETTPQLLEVRGVDLGADPQLRDIKPIHEVAFDPVQWLQGYWPWLLAIAAAIGLAIGLVRWWRNRPVITHVPAATPEVPIHERILAQLREVEKERLWQNGSHKEYHSRITDLLRAYTEERFEVPALESTTDELVKELRVGPIDRDQLARLRNILELSDMVKFAKFVPAPAENEQVLQNAIRFVEGTAMRRNAPIDA